MTAITTTDTILPPVAVQIGDLTRKLIDLPAAGLTVGGKVKISDRARIDVDRDAEGNIRLYVFGVGDHLLAAHSGSGARRLAAELADIVPALNAFADALDAPTAGAGR